jgi:hypothetical protein
LAHLCCFAGAAVLLAGYVAVTWSTIIQARREGGGAEPASLYFDTTKDDPPHMYQVVAQTLTDLVCSSVRRSCS